MDPGTDTKGSLTASALGLGLLPVAPGTWASAAAATVCVAARQLAGPWPALTLGALALLAAVAGLAACPRAMKLYESEDPREFVWDELTGQWLTCLLFWPWGTLANAAGAFALFRLFDVLKPPPVSNAERLPGRWGVMADDLVAALYAAGVLWLAHAMGLRPDL